MSETRQETSQAPDQSVVSDATNTYVNAISDVLPLVRDYLSGMTQSEKKTFLKQLAIDQLPGYLVWTPGATAEFNDLAEAAEFCDRQGGVLFSRCQ